MAFLTRHQHLVKAEEESILSSASVPTPRYWKMPTGDVLLNGSFKTSFETATIDQTSDVSATANPVDI